jgi:hypothetical protein
MKVYLLYDSADRKNLQRLADAAFRQLFEDVVKEDLRRRNNSGEFISNFST